MAVSERTRRAQRALLGAIVFCFLFMGVEVYFGIQAHSLAVLTDAMHLFTDVAALCLALAATFIANWAGSKRLSFGWHRAEVVGAMGSVFLVWGLVAIIVVEGFDRFARMTKCARHEEGPKTVCEGVEGRTMFAIGCAGLCVNLCVAGILMLGGHAHSHGGLAGGSHTCSGGHGHSHGGHGHSDISDDHEHEHESPVAQTVAVAAALRPSPRQPHHHHPSPLRVAADSGAGEFSSNGNESESDAGDHGPLLRPSKTSGHAAAAVAINDGCDGGCDRDDSLHTHSHDHGHGHGHGDSCSGHSTSDRNGGGGGTGRKSEANEANMNVRGAMIHAIGDCVQSVGVIASAGLIWAANGPDGDPRSWYNVADPVCSLIFAAVTLYTTRYLAVDVFFVLMEATPDGVKHEDLLDRLAAVDDVALVEHLHVWSLTPTLKNLTVHIVAPDASAHTRIFKEAKKIIRDAGIWHSAVQVTTVPEDESGGHEAGHELSPLCVGGSKRRFPAQTGAASPRA
jgi:zinc transporter 2